MKHQFFSRDGIWTDGLRRLLDNPTIDIHFVVGLGDQLLLIYDENSKYERDRQLIAECNELDRIVKLSKLIINDKVHGGMEKYGSLKNNIQRKYWLLECFNIYSKDAEQVVELLSKEMVDVFKYKVSVEDKQ